VFRGEKCTKTLLRHASFLKRFPGICEQPFFFFFPLLLLDAICYLSWPFFHFAAALLDHRDGVALPFPPGLRTPQMIFLHFYFFRGVL